MAGYRIQWHYDDASLMIMVHPNESIDSLGKTPKFEQGSKEDTRNLIEKYDQEWQFEPFFGGSMKKSNLSNSAQNMT